MLTNFESLCLTKTHQIVILKDSYSRLKSSEIVNYLNMKGKIRSRNNGWVLKEPRLNASTFKKLKVIPDRASLLGTVETCIESFPSPGDPNY